MKLVILNLYVLLYYLLIINHFPNLESKLCI